MSMLGWGAYDFILFLFAPFVFFFLFWCREAAKFFGFGGGNRPDPRGTVLANRGVAGLLLDSWRIGGSEALGIGDWAKASRSVLGCGSFSRLAARGRVVSS